MTLHSPCVKGNQRVKVSAPSRHGGVGCNGRAEEQNAAREAENTEEIGQGENYHSHEFKGEAKLLALLGKVCYRNASHIENHLVGNPAHANGKIAKDKTAHDGERI